LESLGFLLFLIFISTHSWELAFSNVYWKLAKTVQVALIIGFPLSILFGCIAGWLEYKGMTVQGRSGRDRNSQIKSWFFKRSVGALVTTVGFLILWGIVRKLGAGEFRWWLMTITSVAFSVSIAVLVIASLHLVAAFWSGLLDRKRVL